MGLKVAVIGLAQKTRGEIPWGADWELWGLAWDAERYRLHRAFEMHDMQTMKTAKAAIYKDLPDYFDRISLCQRLYTPEAYSEIPGSERYPYERVAEVCGDWWESSVAYMLSLAITEGAEEIGLHGVLMEAHDEYGYQRPNTAYLIGLARGKGIKVHLPKGCSLLDFSGFDGYHGKYGWRG